MAGVIDMTALKKQLEALEQAALQAARKNAPAGIPPVTKPIDEDDADEGVSMEGPPQIDPDRIAAAPAMQRTPAKAPERHALIRDRKTLRRAVILSEVLAPPVSKRR